jgi:hypothetical protein
MRSGKLRARIYTAYMSEIVSKPFHPKMCCEACVFGQGFHEDWCPEAIVQTWLEEKVQQACIRFLDEDSDPIIAPV